MIMLAAPAPINPNYYAIAISAVVSIAVFWIGYGLNRAASRRERQRKVIEEWMRELASWVDRFADPNSKPEYNYNTLTSRHVIELSLQRKHRYLAWWMHEQAVAIMDRRMVASKSITLRQTCVKDLNQLLLETGEGLLKWHHKELKSVDFHFPYQLQAAARKLGVNPKTYAHSINLSFYLSPIRMNIYRKVEFLSLLIDPIQGTKTLEALGGFARRYLPITLAVSILIRGILGVHLGRLRWEVFLKRNRIKRLEKRITRLSSR